MKSSRRLRLAGRIRSSGPIRQLRHLHRPRYNWMICLACALLIFVTMGLVSSGFSVYFPFLTREYRLSNTQISLLTTVRCLTSFCSMLIVGPFYRLTGARRGVTLATIAAFLSFVLFGMSRSFAGFAIASGFAGVSYGLGSMIPVSILINRWFEDRRSFAMGICAAGSGVATVIASPVITYLVTRTSTTLTFFLEAGAVLMLALGIFSVIRDSPARMGLEPYRSQKQQNRLHLGHGAHRRQALLWLDH